MTRQVPAGSAATDDDLDAVAAATALALAALGADADLLWTATPTALLDLRRTGVHHDASSVRRWAGTLAAAARRGRGGTFVQVGDVLFAFEGANPAATLQPVIDAVARARAVPPASVLVRPTLAGLGAGLRRLTRVRAALRSHLEGPVPLAFEAALHAAVRADGRADAALAAADPALVVVASQHSTASRAVLRAARARGVPTGYLPHAPVADTHQYRDLPTDFAGLRGRREVDFYRRLGVTGELAVVGNPQIDPRPADSLDPDLPVIFAPRPLPPSEVRSQVADVAAASDRVVVSPHPRMRSDTYAALWPDAWEVHEGRTADLLGRGHPCVVQLSSGVAWEAMAYGVPVVELPDPAGGDPLYPLIRSPHALVCATRADVAPAVAQARRSATDPDVRQALVAWSREWCDPVGPAAVTAAVDAVARWAAAGAAPGPLLDRWATTGEAA